MRFDLRRIITQAFFRPGLLGLLINPFYLARRGLFRHVRAIAPGFTGTVVDIGCGSKPYRPLFAHARYYGLEVDTPEIRDHHRADVLHDGQRLPLDDDSCDGAVSFEVLEHVFDPQSFLAEMRRVLKPGGQLLLTTPFVWDEHEQPIDFARYSSFGLRHLLERHGFQVVEHHRIGNDLSVVFQMFNCYLYKKLFGRSPVLNLVRAAILTAPVNLVGLVVAALAPRNDDLYLDNLVVARKLA
ncbi:MAG: methylase [Phycisphaeraceae bacterium]|nr:methylase [Phycisphaeraceae bacterium]